MSVFEFENANYVCVCLFLLGSGFVRGQFLGL